MIGVKLKRIIKEANPIEGKHKKNNKTKPKNKIEKYQLKEC